MRRDRGVVRSSFVQPGFCVIFFLGGYFKEGLDSVLYLFLMIFFLFLVLIKTKTF